MHFKVYSSATRKNYKVNFPITNREVEISNGHNWNDYRSYFRNADPQLLSDDSLIRVYFTEKFYKNTHVASASAIMEPGSNNSNVIIDGETLKTHRNNIFQEFPHSEHKKWTLVCNCVSYSKKNAATGNSVCPPIDNENVKIIHRDSRKSWNEYEQRMPCKHVSACFLVFREIAGKNDQVRRAFKYNVNNYNNNVTRINNNNNNNNNSSRGSSSTRGRMDLDDEDTDDDDYNNDFEKTFLDLFGKEGGYRHFGKKIKNKSLKKICKKLKIKLTLKKKGKRVYKSTKVLKAECRKKLKKLKKIKKLKKLKKIKKPSASLKKMCKRLKVRLTFKRKGKRVFKSIKTLKKECNKKNKK